MDGRSADPQERIHRRPEQVRDVRSRVQFGALHEPLPVPDGRPDM